MAKFGPEDIKKFAKWIDDDLAMIPLREGIDNRDDVLTGKDAWALAHRAGVTQFCYKDRSVVDAHIQTALEQIFPNAVFKDKKVY